MRESAKLPLRTALGAVVLGLLLPLGTARAGDWGAGEGVSIPPVPQIGPQNVASADLRLAHPPRRPCGVTLFASGTLNDVNAGNAVVAVHARHCDLLRS